MECQRRANTLVVLTLLQLCRAEIKDAQPQWFSANVINDGFQLKPISEIFATETSFSTANPIIVSSNSKDDDIQLSTSTPPISLSSSSTFKASTTTTEPLSSQSVQYSSFSPSPSPIPEYTYSPSPFEQYNIDQNQKLYQQNQPSVIIQQQTSPANFEPIQSIQPLEKLSVTELPTQSQRNIQIQELQSTLTQILPLNTPIVNPTTIYQSQPTGTIMTQEIPLELVPQNDQTIIRLKSSTALPPQNVPPQPNYFLIYQQAPQSIQSFPSPSSSPRTSTGEEPFTTSTSPIQSSSSTFSSPSPTFSTISSLPVSTRTSPFSSSTTQSPSTQILSTYTSPRVTVTPFSTIGSSSSISSSTGCNRIVNCISPRSTTPLPILINARAVPLQIDQLFPIKIRVKAPSGSITNVNFNPPAKIQIAPMSTQKHIPSTTTRRPTTRRTPKPRKNTYDRCLQGCRKNGQPLCAAPLSQFPVDPKTLRGFPSVCHMACHNSYRKDAYEKVADGSCGRLRTRIRPIDTNSKLKRDELQKVQYFLDNSEQQPIFEFTGTYS